MSTRITIDKAANWMLAGGTLAETKGKHGPEWYVFPAFKGGGGGPLTEKIAAELRARPDVQPSDDGLLPGIPQTYRLRGFARMKREPERDD